jgi:hypothetical protein
MASEATTGSHAGPCLVGVEDSLLVAAALENVFEDVSTVLHGR